MLKKIVIAAFLIGAFNMGLNTIDLEQTSRVLNRAEATQLAELDAFVVYDHEQE